jgi:hypothetical protein
MLNERDTVCVVNNHPLSFYCLNEIYLFDSPQSLLSQRFVSKRCRLYTSSLLLPTKNSSKNETSVCPVYINHVHTIHLSIVIVVI